MILVGDLPGYENKPEPAYIVTRRPHAKRYTRDPAPSEFVCLKPGCEEFAVEFSVFCPAHRKKRR